MEFTLNTNSWHYAIANFKTERVSPWRGSDICSYTRAFIQGFMWLVLTVAFLAFMACGTLNVMYESVLYLVNDTPLTILGEVFMLLYAVIFFFAGIIGILYLLIEEAAPPVFKAYRKAMNKCVESQEKNPSFLTLAYRKFKDKTCFKIKFNEVE